MIQVKNIAPERIYYGATDAMIAEVGAHEYPDDLAQPFCVMGDGPAQFDTIPCATLAEARTVAREWADAYGVKVIRVN